MAITLNELKAKYAAKATTSTPAVKPASMSGLLGRSMNKTKEVSASAVSTVRGVLPVTTRRFEDIVMELNDKHNNQDRESFKNKARAYMIADAIGVNLPSDEELDILFDEYTAEQEAQEAQAMEEPVEELSDSTINKIAQAMAKVMTANTESDMKARRRAAALEKEEEATEEEVVEAVEEPKKATKPKKEKKETVPATEKKGRRRLGRQEPLAQ